MLVSAFHSGPYWGFGAFFHSGWPCGSCRTSPPTLKNVWTLLGLCFDVFPSKPQMLDETWCSSVHKVLSVLLLTPEVLFHVASGASLLFMGERSSKTQLTKSWCCFFFPSQDFVNHFHVLLPQGISPSKHNIHDFFRKIKLDPDNYQVGRTMVNVFLSDKLISIWF